MKIVLRSRKEHWLCYAQLIFNQEEDDEIRISIALTEGFDGQLVLNLKVNVSFIE